MIEKKISQLKSLISNLPVKLSAHITLHFNFFCCFHRNGSS